MKILIAPDKFKGSLRAAEVGSAISRGFLAAWPGAVVVHKPVADGGEGFADALSTRNTPVRAHDALGREVTASYGWLDESTAVIEMSAASGLWRIAPEERNPLKASSAGTGELIRDAIARSACDILIGIGGSATNDGGIGMAGVLGYRFLNHNGEPMEPIPENLRHFKTIKAPVPAKPLPRIIAACDVNNPLLGEHGATRVYGPQKGATREMIGVLEAGLEHLADLVARDLGCDFRNTPGSGAAGGLGFGLMSFCGAAIRSGFDLVAGYARIEEAIADSDLVITGEGKIDAQTLHGKGPAGVAALARKHNKPVIAFSGIHEKGGRDGVADVFDAVFEIHRPGLTTEESMKNAAALLEALARDVATEIGAGTILPQFRLSADG
ncbi:MAG: glycerate kinase [Methylacidiphilales bacterium]|nr:glycerate kinase [Candidatus Methylacidiphilales bacterium]